MKHAVKESKIHQPQQLSQVEEKHSKLINKETDFDNKSMILKLCHRGQ